MGIGHTDMEQQKKWAQTRETIMSQEVDDVFQVTHDFEMLDAQQQEEKKTKQRLRLMGMKKASEIVLPAYQPKEQLYAEEPQPAFSSARKRQKEIKKEGTVLHARTTNKRLIDTAEEDVRNKSHEVDAFFDFLPAQTTVSFHEKKALFGFLGVHGITADRQFVTDYLAGGDARMKAVASSIREFMKVDYASIELGSDAQIAENARELIKIREQLYSINVMLEDEPNIWQYMDADAKELFDIKYAQAQKLVNFYSAKMCVITDSFYASHLNSEIGHRYDPEASPEERACFLKIVTADAAERVLKFGNDALRAASPEDVNPELTERYRQIQPELPLEFGKNAASTLADRHLSYLTGLEEERGNVFDRLVGGNYHVTGSDLETRESLTRHMFCFANLRACHTMSEGAMADFIKKLAASPADPNDPLQVQAARRENLQGLRIFLDLMDAQVSYLERKYGQGYPVLTPQELKDHQEEFDLDFVNQQGFYRLICYCANFPELFTERDELVRRKYSYYEGTVLSVAGSAPLFLHDRTVSYAGYKQMEAESLADMSGMSESLPVMNDAHVSVNWTETFSGDIPSAYEAVEYITRPATFAALKEQFEKTHGKNEAMHWYNMTPELEALGLNSADLARKIAQDAAADQKRYAMDAWKMQGIPKFSAFDRTKQMPDDLPIDICNLMYRDPQQLALHVLTDQAAQVQFRQIMDRWYQGSAIRSEHLYTAEYARKIANYLSARQGAGPDAAEVLSELRKAFNNVADAAEEQAGLYAAGEGVTIRMELRAFVTKHHIS